MGKEIENFINSSYEISLRVLLLLESFEKSVDSELLTIADFVTTYGLCFGISEYDLNGKNDYKFSEVSARRSLIRKAIGLLVLKHFVSVSYKNNTMVFSLTKQGKEFCKTLKTEYAVEYRTISTEAVAFVKNQKRKDLYSMLYSYSDDKEENSK